VYTRRARTVLLDQLWEHPASFSVGTHPEFSVGSVGGVLTLRLNLCLILKKCVTKIMS